MSAMLLVLMPRVAAACPACLSTAYGDRTFNWAFLGLILMPFIVAAGVGGVLFYKYRASLRAGGETSADALRLTPAPREETT